MEHHKNPQNARSHINDLLLLAVMPRSVQKAHPPQLAPHLTCTNLSIPPLTQPRGNSAAHFSFHKRASSNMARVSAPRLEELVREAEVLSTLKASVPYAWKILEHEIGLARLAAASDRPAPPTPRQSVRKRVKLRVPAEKYPDYNFVGRLLGPRGATLKRLERDTACRIMIRGKGSIRKDKEAEVRGKPGWEHVFLEPLHVVIEVADAADDSTANRILARAKEFVEYLLVPVPEERDSLKRAQLRDLAILNGTHRSVTDLLTPHAALPSPRTSPAASPPPPSRRSSQGLKHSSKPIFNPSHPDSYVPAFDSAPPGVSFARPIPQSQYSNQSAPAPSPPPASSPSEHRGYSSLSSPGYLDGSPRESASYLPDLDKLAIPSLDFDHLSESNITLHSFGMPAASPTIVDPEIYPYPPTPGLLNVDQQIQLNAFASPVWTPSRPMSAGPLSSPSSGLPPRSPRALENAQQTNAFLLGRAMGDQSRMQGSFQRSSSLRESDFSFEEAFASQATVAEDREFTSQAQFMSRDTNANGNSALANLFPPSSVLNSHMPSSQLFDHECLDLRQQLQSQPSSSKSRDKPFSEQSQQFAQMHASQHQQPQHMLPMPSSSPSPPPAPSSSLQQRQHVQNLRADGQGFDREQMNGNLPFESQALHLEHEN